MKSDFAYIAVYGDAVRFNLKGHTLGDYQKGFEYVNDRFGQIAKKNDSAYLQTFVDVKHRDELEFFLERGFFIRNVMLFMDLDLREFMIENEDRVRAAFAGGKMLLKGESEPVTFEVLDTSGDLAEYLEANGLGFGDPDPEPQIREELKLDNAAIYVARHKGKIVSSVTSWDEGDGVIATENIFTIPSYRERGLAENMLLRVLLTRAVKGATRASLSVFGDDCEALNMYYKLGFKLFSEKYELRF